MSGFRLRALLEDGDMLTALQQDSNIAFNGLSEKLLGKTKDAKERFSNNIPDPSSARLLNPIWNGGVEDEFNLEYMDLDEFLIETGLVETNFADIIPPSGLLQQANLQSKKPVESPQPIGLGQLLSQNGISSPSSANTLSPRSSTQSQNTDDEDEPLQTEKHDPQIVKKRKYKEDGQGLTETSVVVVPGQDGFDPASSKFKPEELKPQPIIKKSKKQYVPEESKDEKYWRRRNKNNVAAKRSREARRAKENQIIMRAGFLESENEKLTEENSRLIKENEELKALVERLKSKC